jgi:hypothetical protein
MIPQPGQYYYHYKHNPNEGLNNYAYIIEGIAMYTETEEKMVIYRPLYGREWMAERGIQLFARPLAMFIDEKEVDGKVIQRFTEITDPAIIQAITS